MAQKDFFVGIYEPKDVRRNILECSKEVVDSLQIYESLTKIRSNKLKCYKEIRVLVDELHLLVSRLEKGLPKSHLRKTTFQQKSKEVNELDKHLKDIEKEFLK